MVDITAALEGVAAARELATCGELSSAVAYYETALQQLSRYIKGATEPYALGRAKDLHKKAGNELRSCKEYLNDLCDISGEAQPPAARRPSPEQYDNRRASAGFDDDGFNNQGPGAAMAQGDDPDVWRPPTRDGPPAPAVVRIGPAKAVAPSRARASFDDKPGPAVVARPAPVANRARPAAAGGRAGSKPEPDRPWRANMAGNKAGGAGAGGAVPGRRSGGAPAPAPSSPAYAGPDAELAEQLERDVLDRSPGVRWTDIAGNEDAKRVLYEAAILPITHPNLFTGLVKAPRGVLMFGPPGTGKTMLAKALATESNCTFFSVGSATLGSKYRGESERLVRCLFDLARVRAPAIIFMDEIDSLCSQRGEQGEHEASRRVKTELLTQMDGMQASGDSDHTKRVMVLAATNHPWDIDDAMRRRLEKRVYIPLPGFAEILQMLDIKIKAGNCKLGADVNLHAIAKRLDGYSGSDISQVCIAAAMNVIRRVRAVHTSEELMNKDITTEPIMQADFEQALQVVKSSLGGTDMARHEKWKTEFGAA